MKGDEITNALPAHSPSSPSPCNSVPPEEGLVTSSIRSFINDGPKTDLSSSPPEILRPHDSNPVPSSPFDTDTIPKLRSAPDESDSKRRSSLPDDFHTKKSSLPDGNGVPPAAPEGSYPSRWKGGGSSSTSSSFRRGAFGDEGDASEDGIGIFHIPPKDASVESLRRWRNATLVLNATRRFRYTADLHRDRELLVLRLRTTAFALRAVHRFKLAGSSSETEEPPPPGFGVPPGKLVRILRDKDLPSLKGLGNVHGVSGLLRVNPDTGTEGSPEDLQRRRQAYGANNYPKKAQKNFLIYVWEALQDTTLIILIVCAALALGFGIRNHGIKEGWYDGISIAVAVLLVVLVTAISDFKQSLKFKSLNEEKQNIHVSVKRGGRIFEISIYDLVVGDVVPLQVGDRVPADGLLINGHSLSLDESSMTGESDHVTVDANYPFLLSGSKVANGVGTMLVSAVGERTEWGNLMAALSEDMGGETPLQVRLNGVATFIGQAGLTVAGLVLVILIVFYFTGHTDDSNGEQFVAGVTNANTIVNHIVDILTIAVTIVVVAVPEGLPLAVTLSLAYSMRKMMADKALVRRLSACETMGSATVICSDKTGTLTLNQMTVVKTWAAGEIIESTDELECKLASSVLSLLFNGIAQNTNGGVYVPPGGGVPEISGSPTEKAILEWGVKMGMDFNRVRSKFSILKMEPFNSVKKQSAVVLKSVDSGEVYAHWKGAAELVLESSDRCLEMGGSTIPISQELRMELLKLIEGMAASSLRCIAFALKEINAGEVPREEDIEGWHVPDTGLTLAAIFGIKDPCRPEVHKAVVDCQRAGVKVCMVTGDNLATAKAIALECGILQTGVAIEGKTFRELSDDERQQQARTISVMARSLPSDKLLLVKAFKAAGDVVAVTGDGTNDAPALDEADIGLAMGEQGTEVAKDSSDIIILDDNFSSVVKVVRWGRSIYTNIQKFIQFQLTVNVAALSINFVAAVSSGTVPLTAVQLLWVNLIMDTLGALALATEPPTDDLMLRDPVGRKEPLVTNQMWFHILSQAVYQISVLLTLQFRGNDILHVADDAIINTIIFNAFVFCQIFNEVNARKPSELNIFKGILKNRMFLAIVFSTAVLQVLIVEFLEKFASTVRLDWNHWLICIGIGFVSWPVAFLVKFIPVPKKPFLNTNSSRWRWRWGSRPQAPITQQVAS